MIDRSEPQWYRDAIIYQLHVKSFFDSDNDGIGDFEGLTRKLDYVKDLGATAIWLMPFYPSPLKDDGYDIADYRGINPSYGTLRDFRRFVREAHERGPAGHHRARHQPHVGPASLVPACAAERGLDRTRASFMSGPTPTNSTSDARIIFLDTEKSNWTWDPEAKAFFWHRFYSHQPDLNFDNPRVLEAVSIRCMSGSTWASTDCGSTPFRILSSATARIAKTSRRRIRSSRKSAPLSTRAIPTACCLPRRTNGRRRRRNISAMATNATWRFISR